MEPTKRYSAYDEEQHDPLSPAPTGLGELNITEIIEQVRGWFYENFEDPVEHTPYESAEGGYQYIWGGPYETRDIIENIFADELSDDQIATVVDDIDNDGLEWVPSQRRLQPPEEDDNPLATLSTAQLHERMLGQVAEAEEMLRALEHAEQSHVTTWIGHNHPPEPIDGPPASQQDIEELREALAALKSQPPEPSELGLDEARKSRSVITKFAATISGWIAGQANTFVSKAVEEAGKETGKWAIRGLAAYVALKDVLHMLADTVTYWIGSINLPF